MTIKINSVFVDQEVVSRAEDMYQGRCQILYYNPLPRKARIDHAGLAHHIMARTFNDLFLFRGDADRIFYLSCLAHLIEETGFICYAWVLMDTHVHLLIRTPEQPLWKLKKPLNGDFANFGNLSLLNK